MRKEEGKRKEGWKQQCFSFHQNYSMLRLEIVKMKSLNSDPH